LLGQVASATVAFEVERLRQLLAEVEDLDRAVTLLSWDQQACMPAAASPSRAQQMGLLRRLAHERLAGAEMGRLVDGMEALPAPLDAGDAMLVRAARRSFELARRVPAALVEEAAQATAHAMRAWRLAREESHWGRFAPCLDRNVDIHLRIAGAIGYDRHPYDALLARREPLPDTVELRAIFDEIERAVVPLLAAVQGGDDGALRGDFDEGRQLELARWLLRRVGFDFDRGRLDVAAHPLCASPGPDDVRIAVRTRRDSLATCLFATLHEGGHALYDQGVDRALDRTPLWPGAASAVHESQARLWENLVGRSRPFWDFLAPVLREAFGLSDVDAMHRAANAVRRSYVRAEADEVTYNLHVLIRFEIENDLLEGRLEGRDVPEAWNAALRRSLGLAPPPLVDGPLQDIQWCGVTFGLFPTYTLGNLASAQLMMQARADLADLDGQVRAGDFGPLLSWLREKVHRHGRAMPMNELLVHVTGAPLTAGPWIEHVRRVCAQVHGVPA
jgi:carboxypeptidase Taq